MSSNKKYVSVFKIKGEPILPPLMTKSKRNEMLKYKELAVALENQRKMERPPTQTSMTSLNSEDIKHDFLQVPQKREVLKETASQGTDINPPVTRAGSRITIQDLQKSDTFIYDIKNNTVIIPQSKENEPQTNLQKSQLRERGSITRKPNELLNDESRDDLSRQYILFMEKARALSKQQRSPTTPPKPAANFGRPVTSPATNKPVPFDKQVCVQIIETKTTLTPNKKLPSPPPSASTPKNSHPIKNENLESITERISPRKKILPNMSCSLNENLEVPEAPKIIRSNSFTLENPSPVLLRHLRSQAQAAKEVSPPKEKIVKQASKEMDASLEKNEVKKTTTEKVVAPKPPSKVSSLIFSNTAIFKGKKSPYEIKSNTKAKIKKHKSSLKKTISSISIRAKPQILADKQENDRLSPQKIIENNKNVQNFQEIIKSIQEDHELKLLELAKRQREEQKQMEEAFAEQQRILLQEISAKMCNMNVDPMQRSSSSTPQSANSNVTVISKTSPRHSKQMINPPEICSNDYNEEVNPIASALCKNYLKTAKQSYLEPDVLKVPNCSLIERGSPRCSRQLFANNSQTINSNKLGTAQLSPTKRKHEAATIINAFVRGYLTRRVFRTDHVQRIVQTIRDTLVFVLDLYEETKNEEETEESITLKARLLQQLTSACYELNSVFFKMSIKERMNLIAKDRAYIRTRAQIRSRYTSPRI